MSVDVKREIEQANGEFLRRVTSGNPVLVDVAPAGEVYADFPERTILHSGPPVVWRFMSGAQRGACIGAALFEGWAADPGEAVRLLQDGQIALAPNHPHSFVGPMAGTITPSMWVWVVENETFRNRACCRQVESRQQFGEYSEEALAGLEKWRDVWAPALQRAVRKMGGLPLKPIITKALQMGDELHNRPIAASSLFANAMSVPLLRCGLPEDQIAATMGLLAGHELLFLGLSMAAGKSIADAARDIPFCTGVTAMARNGSEFGIQVSGLEGEWFTAPAPEVTGLYLPGYKRGDEGRDIGDSAITETVGWGGFVLGGATGILNFVGGTPEEAFAYSRQMRQITIGQSPDYLIPPLGFEGTAVGIDIRKVVQSGTLPIIDTAMAHKEPGHPIVGAGLVRPPMECFKQALKRFAEKYTVNAATDSKRP
ncbi:MAG: DUF1116 domain-containing protein [Candidatus Bipolaricaulota bacterium]